MTLVYDDDRTMDSRLQSQADALRWYHTIDLGQGVVTKGIDDTPLRLARIDLPRSLDGRTVLDIGAWDGFFSFEAERRGASRVVATITTRGTGADGARRPGSSSRARTLGSSVEDIDIDVMDLSPERVGTFDVVLFLGVLYHLPHPLLALERVASVTRELLILETVVDMVGISRPVMAYYPGRDLNGDPTNWWGPKCPGRARHAAQRRVSPGRRTVPRCRRRHTARLAPWRTGGEARTGSNGRFARTVPRSHARKASICM